MLYTYLQFIFHRCFAYNIAYSFSESIFQNQMITKIIRIVKAYKSKNKLSANNYRVTTYSLLYLTVTERNFVINRTLLTCLN